MRTWYFLLAILFFSSISQMVAAQNTKGAELKLNKEFHDFGTINENSKGSCAFILTNTGDEPLTIISAKGSCGCTVPTYSDEPIEPGKSIFMHVNYDTKRLGPIKTSVTMFTTAANAKMKVVYLKGNVVRPINIPKSPTQKE